MTELEQGILAKAREVFDARQKVADLWDRWEKADREQDVLSQQLVCLMQKRFPDPHPIADPPLKGVKFGAAWVVRTLIFPAVIEIPGRGGFSLIEVSADHCGQRPYVGPPRSVVVE